MRIERKLRQAMMSDRFHYDPNLRLWTHTDAILPERFYTSLVRQMCRSTNPTERGAWLRIPRWRGTLIEA